jgi:Asp-tRNA(Asn)/Glu-tRNA(Gln) amidotransferase A subunit family amidase
VALEAWLARNPNSPFHSRADIGKSPDLGKVFPPTKAAGFTRPAQPPDMQKYADYLIARQELMTNLLKVMADNKLDAIVYRTVEHSPTLISEGIKPPYPTNKGVPILNTFLVYVPVITVPSGFTPEKLPTGITFMGGPYSDAKMISLAYAYEQATHHRIAPTSTPPLSGASAMTAASGQ